MKRGRDEERKKLTVSVVNSTRTDQGVRKGESTVQGVLQVICRRCGDSCCVTAAIHKTNTSTSTSASNPRSYIAAHSQSPVICSGRRDRARLLRLRRHRRHRHHHHCRARLRGNAYPSAGCAVRRRRQTKSQAKTRTNSSLRRRSSVGVDAGCRRHPPRASSLAQTAASRTSAAALGSRSPDRDLPRFRPRVQTRLRRGPPCSVRNEAA